MQVSLAFSEGAAMADFKEDCFDQSFSGGTQVQETFYTLTLRGIDR
jgi:hypothetical protein